MTVFDAPLVRVTEVTAFLISLDLVLAHNPFERGKTFQSPLVSLKWDVLQRQMIVDDDASFVLILPWEETATSPSLQTRNPPSPAARTRYVQFHTPRRDSNEVWSPRRSDARF